MKRILITGGAGFIGYHLACALAADPAQEVWLIDNLQRGQLDADLQALIARPNVVFQNADLTRPESLSDLPRDMAEIYHLAAMVGVKHCMQQPGKVLQTNLQMTQNLIAWASRCDFPRLLFASTSEIYAGGYSSGILPVPTPEDIPICIEDLRNPRFSYAVSKIAGEQLIRFLAPEAYDFKIVRFHNIYGPRMGFAHVIPEVLRRIQAGETPFQAYGAEQTRAFCYVTDAVAQLQAVMQHSGNADPVFHLGNASEEIQILDLLQKLFALSDYSAPLVIQPAPPGSVDRRCPDLSRLLQIWQPHWTPLDEGLALTRAWYQKHMAQQTAHHE